MAVTVGLVAQLIEKIAPKSWAEEWDNVGLLVGSGSKTIERILITLDGTLEVVEEAKAFNAQLIVAHHPVIFRPLKNLRADNAAAQVPLRLLQHEIGYYAAHTNLDQSVVSPSRVLGELIGLEKMEPLERVYDVNPSRNSEERGYGVSGYLTRPQKLGVLWQNFLDKLKESGVYSQAYELTGVRLAGSLEREVRKVAIVNGSGGRFVPKALFKGADLLITGDVDHHAVLDALEGGMAVGDLGHFLSEAPMLRSIYDYLSSEKSLQGIEIRVSSVNRSPWL
ncbi:Nif3-like dinuclear metal center hexameric protein [Desulfosporosinus nitroreducens]|uniref:Nif3-like dinuclear metal center hexameric protein n=1 Tax=Desulfosporosinus nitroreducens TaxID=2018668 RepID=UPI00207C3DDE|nr:Nif3-like dinuclear metal center hexameric protein [Desulfosporosinus nitroreducens]MCO1601350.1 Nif3-like dinuclear metal center hexameric protein [Desulfosporosinus nitroreducens]